MHIDEKFRLVLKGVRVKNTLMLAAFILVSACEQGPKDDGRMLAQDVVTGPSPFECAVGQAIDYVSPALTSISVANNYEIFRVDGPEAFGHDVLYVVRFMPLPGSMVPPGTGEFSAVVLGGSPDAIASSIAAAVERSASDALYDSRPGDMGWPGLVEFAGLTEHDAGARELLLRIDASAESYGIRGQLIAPTFFNSGGAWDSPWQIITVEGANTDVTVLVCTGRYWLQPAHDD